MDSREHPFVGQCAPKRSWDLAARVRALIGPVAEEEGLELVAALFEDGLLRLVVDRSGASTGPPSPTRAPTFALPLEAHDPLPGRYTLEERASASC